MRYPNGKTYQKKESDNKTEKTHRTLLSAANRGMSLEEDINESEIEKEAERIPEETGGACVL